MKKQFIAAILFTGLAYTCFGQIKWGVDTALLTNKEWQNYSTSYIGPETETTTPTIVTAIPYNGIYSHNDEYGSPFAMSNSGYMYSFRSYLSKNSEKLYTYDSSEVYFLTPCIHPVNAAQYEYRVLLNAQTIIKPWSSITQFTDNSFQLNLFKRHMGYLGGYKTVWDNFIVVELRKKGSDSIMTSALVYWKQTRPKLLQIYTPNDVSAFFKLLKETYDPYEPEVPENDYARWLKEYPSDQIDPDTHLPKKLILRPGENNIVFYLTTGIYKKEAVEYQLLKNGDVQTDWKPNDNDNSFIWLKNLSHGSYLLHLRYRAQRQNVTEYPFEIKPAWYQTWLFKIMIAVLIAAFFAAIVLSNRLARQRRKTETEKAKKNRLSLELKAIHAQLNPHFIFNSLSSIQGMVNNSDIKGANRYLSEFGNLLRNTLTAGNNEFTALQNETAVLDTYLTLERLRFGFTYGITVDKNINTSETEIPSLLLQPLVENAVKHGVSGLQEEGIISVAFYRQGDDMIVTVKDNGNGFAPAEPAGGYGLKLTKERIALLNQVLKGQSIEFFINAQKATGTTAQLLFKNWLAWA